MKFKTKEGKEIEIIKQETSYLLDSQPIEGVRFSLQEDGFIYLHLADRVLKGWLESYNVEEKSICIQLDGGKYDYQIVNRYDELLKALGMENIGNVGQDVLKAPMPGKVVEILAKEGDAVEEGSPLLILEAMKMENVLKATGSAMVKKIHVAPSDTVEKNKVLIDFE